MIVQSVTIGKQNDITSWLSPVADPRMFDNHCALRTKWYQSSWVVHAR